MRTAKRISAACVALILAVGVVGSTLALTACGGSKDEYDFNGFYASATYGVTLLVGQTFTLSNCNVYGMTGETADSDEDLCIAGMRADSEYADTVILLDADGKSTDGVQITSSSQTVTMQYTGEKYTYPEGADTFTYTISASYATSAEVVPYTLSQNGSVSAYAEIGDGADAMSVIVYYDGGSDTHADNTITVTNAEGGSVLAEGLNTITATSVCLTSSGSAVSVPAVYLYIEEIEDETGTVVDMYTAYSNADMSGDALYSYEFVKEWGEDWTVYRFDGTKGDDSCVFAVYANGYFVFGSESQTPDDFSGSANGGTIGYWGYIDGELVFVRGQGVTQTETNYFICEMTTNSDGSVTISDSHGTAVSGTITDIGCLVGDGYDLSGFTISTDEAE